MSHNLTTCSEICNFTEDELNLIFQSESSLLSLQEKQRREVEERRAKEVQAAAEKARQREQREREQRERDRREREGRMMQTKVEPGFPSPLFQNRLVQVEK